MYTNNVIRAKSSQIVLIKSYIFQRDFVNSKYCKENTKTKSGHTNTNLFKLDEFFFIHFEYDNVFIIRVKANVC